ncbi:hypothetical protein HPB49_006941 [Dermacentor silvarum]|uniref:Uncharacterized protein n=1 Tax=Dermacentor silvarum TaxID=543639 RepID=A0ACB8DWM3_DERSI|nr:hypothetical protein HPB49_006941 [Dermacentor silvarum]
MPAVSASAIAAALACLLWPDPLASYLLITTSVGIQQSFVESKGESHFLYNSNTLAVAVDFLLSGPKTTVFWSDINTDQINAGEVVEGRLKDVRSLVTGGLESVEGLAVDWIACNLYWVESRHQEIEVSRCDGSMRASVVGDVRRPRGLALDPRVGFLFWTDWNDENPRIERSYLDGSSRKVIVNVEEYSNLPKSLPNGITLDYAVNRVYWIDASQNQILYWIEGRMIKRHMLKTYTTEIFAEFGSLVKLTALSLDCLSGNLYIGNSVQLNSEIRSQISVCATGGRYCSNLIWDSVRHVSGLAVDAANRLVDPPDKFMH